MVRTRTIIPYALAAIGIAYCVSAVGCKSSLPIIGGDRETDIVVLGGTSMNGGGNAAVVRVYQLSSDTKFQHASIEDFWKSDVDALGSELVGASQELIVYPKDTKTLDVKLDEATQYVGVAADLRSPDQDQWRVVLPVHEINGRKVLVTVGENRLETSTQ